ncbi:MAG TPA: hypothetical protein VFB37_01460, partial [Steroidobacteraceae bacterium]|nr:hypothetical protein [Steroidobacteraceae bacterium]
GRRAGLCELPRTGCAWYGRLSPPCWAARTYILKQLGSFQSNMRNVAVMYGVALNLRLTDMEAVARYLESQP